MNAVQRCRDRAEGWSQGSSRADRRSPSPRSRCSASAAPRRLCRFTRVPRDGLTGVHNILATPFDADGAIDFASLRRLIDATVEAGVDGVTVLGVAGEAKKLTAAERSRVLDV